MGSVFAEMSSWTALICHTGMKVDSQMSLEVIEEKKKKNTAHYNKELVKLDFSATVVLVSIFV